MLQVEVDTDKCIGSGACVQACPEVFSLDDDGVVVLLDPDPPPELASQVREAVAACPAEVIRIVGE